MAKKLGSDGRPIDVPTKPTRNDDSLKPRKSDDQRKGTAASSLTGGSSSEASRSGSPRSTARPPKTRGRIDLGDEPTVAVGSARRRGTGVGDSGDTTRPALSFPSDGGDLRPKDPGSADSPQRTRYRPGDEGDTVVWGGSKLPRRGDGDTAASRVAQAHPVTGWLVVVDGPGKGSAVQLGFGHNTIGRGPAMRVRLDFGDRKISRDTHATLTYDPKGNAFYLQPGKNLTYFEDQPVLSPVPLGAGALIGLGDTALRFVPFCDETFTWE